jgi:hypothetical protein
MTLLLAGGFLFLVYVGSNDRPAAGGHIRATLPASTARQETGYFAAAKAGGRVVAGKAEDFFGGLFGGQGTSSAPEGATGTETADASAGSGSGSTEEDNNQAPGDSFEKYYEKNYGVGDGSDGNGGGGGVPSWAETGDSSSSSSSGPSASAGGKGAAGGGKSAAKPAAGANASDEDEGSPAFGKPAASPKKPLPRMLASLPGGSPVTGSGSGAAQQPAYGGSAGWASGGGKGGSVGGFSSGGKAGDLNGAAENMKTGSQSSYNSKMSMDVGAMKRAASAGASPKPVASSGGSGGSSGSGGSGGSGGSSSPKTDTKTAAAAPQTDGGNDDSGTDTGGVNKSVPDDSGADLDLVDTVVNESKNGKDANFVAPADMEKGPDETMLKTGATKAMAADKEVEDPDPKDLNSLSDERKLELKKDMHTLIKGVDNRYGSRAGYTSQVEATPCSNTPDVCKAHGLSGKYVTITINDGTRMDFGLKYVKNKWRVYTVDFKRPDASGDTELPEEEN